MSHICKHLLAVIGCANSLVSPAAQDDPTGASEAENGKGAQQAVQGG